MAIYKILHFPNPLLRQKTLHIPNVTEEIKTLISDMFETMYDARGVGLAATQIGINLSLAVIDTSKDKTQQLVLINPEILEARNETSLQEGCLSVPGHYDTVKRATWVKLRAQDITSETYEIEADDLLAHAIQHEVDHLHGVLYIDKLSPLKKARFKKKYEKHHHCASC